MNSIRIGYFFVGKKSAIFFGVTFLVVLVFVALTILADLQAQKSHEKIFNDQQAMLASATVRALQERVNAIFVDVERVADYRVPRNYIDKRGDASLVDTLLVKIALYPEILAYVYMDSSGNAVKAHSAEIQAGSKAESLCLEWGEQFWSEMATAGKELFVPPFHVTNTNQILGLLLPVRIQGEFSGVLAVAIDLEHLAEHYVGPLHSKKYGHGFMLDGQGNVAYDRETQIIGRNVFDGLHGDYPELLKLDKRFLSEPSGKSEYVFTVARGGESVRKLVAWDSVKIGERKLVLCLTSPDTEINEHLHSLTLQRFAMTGFLALLAIAALFFLNWKKTILQKSEEKFRRLVENLGKEHFFYSHGHDRVITYVSPSITEMLGYEQQEFTVDYETLLTDSPINNAIAQKTQEGLEGKKQPPYEVEVFTNTGSRRQLEIAEGPVFDSKGEVLGIEGLARDITEKKKSEEALRESEGRYRRLIDNAQDVIYRISIPGGRYEYIGSACTVMFGYTPEEFYANPLLIRELIHPRWEDYFNDEWAKLVQGDMSPTYEYQIIDKAGQERWFFQINILIRDEAGNPVALEGIVRDITSRKDAQIKLEQEQHKAQVANLAKSEFLASMSHEIRTPLNGVLGVLQLMQTTDLDAEQKQFILTAIQSSKRLNMVLSDILDISRVEAGKLTIQTKLFSLNELMQQVSDLFQSLAQQVDVDLFFHTDPRIPTQVVGDPARLQQILNNMVGNALKFTTVGSIMVDAYSLPIHHLGQCRVLFTVSDTGVGIPDDKVETLFESFTQVTEGCTRKQQGVGLGLAICKRLVALMGGNLAVETEFGVGTGFYFCISFDLLESATEQTKATVEQEERSFESLNILVADDEKVNRMVSQKMLEKAGCKVTAVKNGQQALDALRQDSFDVVLMDVQMPVMDGVEATKAIRCGEAGEHNKQIPIIALTAHVMAGDKEKFLEAGMDDYASKPVEVKTLRTILSKVIREAREG